MTFSATTAGAAGLEAGAASPSQAATAIVPRSPSVGVALRRRLLDAALGYSESSPALRVIPVDPVEKKPSIKTGTDHAEHTSTDPQWLARMFGRFPSARLGIVTGWPSGIIVIDADSKHDGEARLAELENALGPLPRVRVVRTKSGGLHLYFARPVTPFRISSGAGAKSALGRLLGDREGVDVRADGGFVVAPPTPGYEWIADDDEPFPELPPVWLAAICGMGDPPRAAARVTARLVDASRTIDRARAYLATMDAAIEGQTGSNALMAAIVAVRVGFDLSPHVARAMIECEYNPRCVPPWSERELDHKFADVERPHAKRPPRGYLLGAD